MEVLFFSLVPPLREAAEREEGGAQAERGHQVSPGLRTGEAAVMTRFKISYTLSGWLRPYRREARVFFCRGEATQHSTMRKSAFSHGCFARYITIHHQ